MERQHVTIHDLSDRDVIKSLYLSQGLMFILSLFIYFIFIHDTRVVQPYFHLTMLDALYGVFFGAAVVIVDMTMMKLLPDSWLDDGGINERVFKVISVSHVFFAMFVVALSEEILFRGMLLSRFGIIISSLCFALVHVRYLKKPLLLFSVIILSFALGFLYMYTESIFSTIIAHYVIDVSLGLLIKRKQIIRYEGRGLDE